MTLVEAALALVALLVVLSIAAAVLVYALVGALEMFGWAAGGGFVGIVAFIAAWVFLFPLMAAASVAVGALSRR